LNDDIASFEVVSFITETQGVVNGKHDIVNITFTYAASCEGDETVLLEGLSGNIHNLTFTSDELIGSVVPPGNTKAYNQLFKLTSQSGKPMPQALYRILRVGTLPVVAALRWNLALVYQHQCFSPRALPLFLRLPKTQHPHSLQQPLDLFLIILPNQHRLLLVFAQ
jgi:hypothetical protein